MSGTLLLIMIVAGSYLAAHVAFDWIATRYRIVSGAEYLVLGFLLGPQVSGLLSEEALAGLSPLVTLGLGWAGAQLGSRLSLNRLIRIRGLTYRVAFVESVLTLLVVGAAELVVISMAVGIHAREAIIPALALGAMAAVSSEAGIAVAVQGKGPRHPLVRQLQTTTIMNSLVAVAVFGILTAVFRGEAVRDAVRVPTATEWVVINVAIGAVGGGLFHLFVGAERKPDRLLIALVGAIVLVSGAAAWLRLSPLLAAVVFGIILANTSLRRGEIETALSRVDRPLHFTMLVLAGALWAPSAREWMLPVLVFIGMRAVGKVGGGRLAARANGRLGELGSNWSRGLLGQGSFSLIIGLNYLQLDLPIPNVVFTAVLLSVLLTDLVSARLAGSVFRTDEGTA